MISLILLACATTESSAPVANTPPPPAAPAPERAAVTVEFRPGPRLAVIGGLWCAATRSDEVRCGIVESELSASKDPWERRAKQAVEAAGLRDVRALRLGAERVVTLHGDGQVRVLEFQSASVFPTVTGSFRGLSRGAAARTLCGLDAEGMATCWSEEWTTAAAPAGPFLALADTLDGGVCGLRTNGSLSCWETSSGEALKPVSDPVGPFQALAYNVNGLCLAPKSGPVTCSRALPSAPATAELVTLSLNPGDPSALSGLESACGLTAAGALLCWGNVGEAPAGRFVDVASEDAYTCALRDDDQVLCWKHPKLYETGPGAGD